MQLRLSDVGVTNASCKSLTIFCPSVTKLSFSGSSQSMDSCQSLCRKIFARMLMGAIMFSGSTAVMGAVMLSGST